MEPLFSGSGSTVANIMCPGCGLVFGFVITDKPVTCPICDTTQDPPIFKIGQYMYWCQKDKITFGALQDQIPTCHTCGSSFSYKDPRKGGAP